MSRFRGRLEANSELDVEVKGGLAMLPLESGGAASSALLNPGSIPLVPVKSRRWRHTVAWTVALCVLLFVLVWVGGGGLDIPASSTSAVGASGAPDGGGGFPDGGGMLDEGEAAEKEQRSPEPAVTRTENLAKPQVAEKEYRGEVTSQMRKTASAKGLTKEEIAEIERAANDVVNEALRGPGVLPVASPQKYYSEACNVMVDGLPLIGSKQQRCCNVANIQGIKRPDGGAAELLSAVRLPPKRPNADRVLEAGLGEGGGGEGGDGGLPAAVKTESTGGVKDEGLACFPSFVIAGTQKSGTTALAGILEKHPQVQMAARKELHFFDTKPPNTKTSELYASSFGRLNGSEAMENQGLFVTGEATPFYLASRNACMHISKLLPDARLIVLVREPVKRSYSEHQMKVRRVEEQQEMLKLLPLNANVVYDCVTQILHSDVHNITKREEELLRDPQSLSAAIGECAGEVGQHGKWTDVMFPFARRLRTQLRALSTDTARVIEGVREDFSRCFPLKSIAQAMERIHPGGAWKAHWSKKSFGPVTHSMGERATNPRPHTPVGDLAHVPGAIDRQHRNLQHYQYYQNGEGTGGEKPLHGAASDGAYVDSYQNRTDPRMPLAASDQHPARVSEGWENRFPGAGNPAYSGFEQWREGGRPEHGTQDDEFLEGEGWEGWMGDGLDGAGWGGGGVGGDWPDEHRPEEGGIGVPRVFDGGYSERPAAYTYAAPGALWPDVNQQAGGRAEDGRRLHELASEPGMWGVWGQSGERVHDETCYVKMERVAPVAEVMRQELSRLKKCFGVAMLRLSRLGEVPPGESLPSAKAMDDKIKGCFTVTPGISDQYVYRSLYDVQAYHCLKHIPREQILFIETDDLRDRPEEIMPMVHQHIGISNFEYASLGQEAIMAELDKKYPDFEKRTGWRLDSAYKEEMPEDLAQEMREFFKPHMQIFARLVGQSFGTWAVDDQDKQEAMAGGSERATEVFEEEFGKAIVAKAAEKKLAAKGAALAEVKQAKPNASEGASAGDRKR